MTVRTTKFIFKGGLELERPYQTRAPGVLIDAINYEALPLGGYRRVKGYKKIDGQSSNPQNVPGQGAVLGVWVYKGSVYAFRDATGGATAKMYKATGAGWTEQALGIHLKFKLGTAFFKEGNVVTGATSGASGTVRRVSNGSGTTTGSTLAGALVLSGVTGTFANNEVLNVSAAPIATADGSQVATTLPPGGVYRFWNYNFYAGAASQRMYGANGAGPAFEWDGTYFVPILQAYGAEYPSVVVGHSDHLIIGFGTSGILRTSSLGAPLDYLTTTGASEFGFGDSITDMRPNVGGVLFIAGGGNVKVLYGSNASDWVLKRFSDNGCRARTMKEIGGAMAVLDSRGVQRIDQTASFGDFQSLALSVAVNRRLLVSLQGITAPVSIVSRVKDQYRLFFGKTAYYFTFNGGKLVGIMPVTLKHSVNVAAEGEATDGAELIVFGSSAGEVFQMDSADYFDGELVQGALQLEYADEGAPTMRKQYRMAEFYLEVEGAKPTLSGRVTYDFNVTDNPPTELRDLFVGVGGGTQWDVAQWDTFEWAGDGVGAARLHLGGTGQNMSIVVFSSGFNGGMHTFQSGMIHWSPRRLTR